MLEERNHKAKRQRKGSCKISGVGKPKVSLWKAFQTFLVEEAVILSSSAYLPSRSDGQTSRGQQASFQGL